LNEIFGNFYPKVILEAGASDGEDTLNFCSAFPEAKVYALEPVKEQYEYLLRKLDRFPNCKIFNLAFSSNNGIARIQIGKSQGELGGMGSSSMLPPKYHHKLFPEISFAKFQEVNTVTIKDFSIQNEITKIDLLWLDLQGLEFITLNASKDYIELNVYLIHLELSRVELYAGMTNANSLFQLLKKMGFKCKINRVGAVSGNALFINTRLM